jgi:hypothetical protein
VNILNDSLAEENAITLQNTIDATGISTHLNDGSPNPGNSSGSYFKHQSINIAYNQNTKAHNNTITSTQTAALQTFIDNISTLGYIQITDPCANVYTSTFQLVINEIIRNLPGFQFSNV